MLGPEVAGSMGQALDHLCPPLRSSPLLETKALRAVLSVGVEVVVLDALLSAAIGKLDLSPEDALTADDTEGIFGTFGIPSTDGDTGPTIAPADN